MLQKIIVRDETITSLSTSVRVDTNNLLNLHI